MHIYSLKRELLNTKQMYTIECFNAYFPKENYVYEYSFTITQDYARLVLSSIICIVFLYPRFSGVYSYEHEGTTIYFVVLKNN
jgi:hypothetical protein